VVSLPTNTHSYDVVLLIDVLHHIPQTKQYQFVQAIYNAMPIGGRCIIKDIDASNPLVYCNKLHDLIFSREIGHEVSYNNALHLLESVGFMLIRKVTYNLFHLLAIAAITSLSIILSPKSLLLNL
jgi:2-polyprenyl-3-methyl-5-hydroxy-6-metoxy-1,4-benzoquinol methylase